MKALLIRGVAALVVIGLLIGAWQVAYARGKDEGRAEGVAIRTEFTQARQSGGAASGASTGSGSATKPAGGGNSSSSGSDAGSGFTKPGAGGRPGVNGTIEKVEADAVTVTTNDGSVRVTVGEQTRIGKQVQVPVTELKVGERIVVFGERKSDREYAATAIQVQPAGQ